jgi:hypothetical protein
VHRQLATLESLISDVEVSGGGGGSSGISLPAGGTAGQVLVKTGSGEEYAWRTLGTLPQGGTEGQVLVKIGTDDYVAEWQILETSFSGATAIDGGDAPLTDPQSNILDGGDSTTTPTETVDGGDSN